MGKRVFWQRGKVTATAAALALVVAGLSWAQSGKSGAAPNPPVKLKIADSRGTAVTNRLGFAPVIKEVLPAVVSIRSSKMVKTSGNLGQGQLDPFFRQFFGDNSGSPFGNQMPREQRQQGVGSGVIVSPDGYILTNNHVVDGANDVEVTLSDKRQFKARVVGTDSRTDIAVVKIDATSLPVVTVGDSDKIEVGDFALAIGNPFDVGETVTMGIVSATRRGGLGIEDQEDFIQTDAPINPGNSGGALVNDRGELIGINTAILANGSSGNQGIGFAVPVNLARNVMDQLVKNGKVTRAYLGIYLQDVTPSLARAMGVKDSRGALVGDVSAGTPAERAGIKSGDIITGVDGKPVADGNQLRNTISSLQPDSKVNLNVLRDGHESSIAVTLGELPKEEAQAGAGRDGRNRGNRGSQESGEAMPGVSVENLTAQMARQLGVNASTGVVVTDVDPNSAAAESGLRQGDVIQEVNRQPVHNVSEFERAVRGSNQGNLLLVNREGRKLFVGV